MDLDPPRTHQGSQPLLGRSPPPLMSIVACVRDTGRLYDTLRHNVMNWRLRDTISEARPCRQGERVAGATTREQRDRLPQDNSSTTAIRRIHPAVTGPHPLPRGRPDLTDNNLRAARTAFLSRFHHGVVCATTSTQSILPAKRHRANRSLLPHPTEREDTIHRHETKLPRAGTCGCVLEQAMSQG